MRHTTIRAGIVLALAVPTALHAVPASAAAQPASSIETSSSALFEGHIIDMTTDRSEALACAITDTGNRCYRSEPEMDLAEAPGAPSLDRRTTASQASRCSSSVRLYSGTDYSGTVTSITTRSEWINLSALGIDNTTSSYTVGSCSAAFRSGAFGTGSAYPGSTSAFSRSSSMATGWDNVVSSILLT